MMIFIARHGKAQQRSASGRDEDRALRPKGTRQAAYLGEQLAAMPDRPGAVLMSPYLRTTDTAAIIAEALELHAVIDERLICDAPPDAAMNLIAEYASLGVSPCLVGHNPQVSVVVSALLGGVAGRPVAMRTGELAALETDEPQPIGHCRLVHRLRLEKD